MSSAAFWANHYPDCLFTHSFLTGYWRKNVPAYGANGRFCHIRALILSLTYIPMMSALFLSKNSPQKNIADRLMDFFNAFICLIYPVGNKTEICSCWWGQLPILATALVIFGRMGGEFIPQLQEGDYAFHCILPQGTSLTQSGNIHASKPYYQKSFPK